MIEIDPLLGTSVVHAQGKHDEGVSTKVLECLNCLMASCDLSGWTRILAESAYVIRSSLRVHCPFL